MVGYANLTRNGEGTTTTTVTTVPEKSTVAPPDRKRYIGRSVYWSPEEQSLLEKLIPKYASYNLVQRYAKIAVKLKGEKTIYDVALRVRWMTEKAAGQQVIKPSSHATNHSNGRLLTSNEDICYKAAIVEQNNDQVMNQVSANGSAFKEKAACQQVKPFSDATKQSNGLDHAPLSTSVESDEDTDDDDSYEAIGGAAMHLLEQINQALNHIDANMTHFKGHGLANLTYQMINNIDVLVNESVSNVPEKFV